MANCGIMVGIVREKKQINITDCLLSIDGYIKNKTNMRVIIWNT